MSDEAALAIARALGSIWSLELLIILNGNQGKRWLAVELERELRGNAHVVGDALQVLERLGLAATDTSSQWAYTPTNAELNQAVGELVHLYMTKRVTVINAIYASATDRMRAFASAFKIRDE